MMLAFVAPFLPPPGFYENEPGLSLFAAIAFGICAVVEIGVIGWMVWKT